MKRINFCCCCDCYRQQRFILIRYNFMIRSITMVCARVTRLTKRNEHCNLLNRCIQIGNGIFGIPNCHQSSLIITEQQTRRKAIPFVDQHSSSLFIGINFFHCQNTIFLHLTTSKQNIVNFD